ncbi:MAG: glycosyltransferase [Lachnospiraceae bacterium]|nr:glycosyltransferase [Lachnospiraceae bacterium]
MEGNNRPVFISVIVPVYNTVEYLPRCVDSIRRQTYRNLEIILVDDGSTDTSGAMAEKFALEDKRVRVFHKENGGSSSARNLGIEKARGDYIGFVDSDDYIEPEMYERLLSVALSENLPMVQCSRDEIDEQGNLMENVCIPPEEPELWEDEKFMRELLMHRGDCSFCTKLIRADLLKSHRFPEGELNEDFRLLTELLPQIPLTAILPQQDYHVFYRYGSNTRTRNKDEFPRVFMDIVNNADRAEELVAKKYPNLIKEAERFALYQRLDYMLHIPISMMNKKNTFYVQVCTYLKHHKKEIRTNPYLTKKNRQYLMLFAAMPVLVRKVHAKLKRLE